MILVFLLYFQDLWPYLQRLVVNGSCLCIRSSVSLTPCRFFFFTKAFGYVQIFIALQKFDQKSSYPHNCMICLSSAGILSKVFYYVCYSICKMYDTCSMFTMIFTFLWNSVLITYLVLHLQQWYSLSVRNWFWFFFNWIHSWLVNCFGFFYSYMLS